MRILHVSTRLILGGSQENTVLSCEGQARLGHEVHLAFGPIYGPEGSLLERVEAFNRRCRAGLECTPTGQPCLPVVTHVVPHLRRRIAPLADARAYIELRRLVGALKPDVVHTHSSKAGVLGRAAAWAWNARRSRASSARESLPPSFPCAVVHTIHGPPFMPLPGQGPRRWWTAACNALYAQAERFAARRCHLIVSVADAMTREFLACGIGTPGQYVTVYSGIEAGLFLDPLPGQTREQWRRRLGLADGDFVIGTVARLAQHKGHDDLLDALAEDLTRRPHWKLLWVGDGWWRDRLMRRVRAQGLAAQVITTGLVLPQDIPGCIRAMDVLVHPSYREGLPRTVVQALLCGVVPVAYDVDGTGEVCRPGQTGLLVPPGDRRALREAVLWVAEHSADAHALAARGRELCRDLFAAERMIEALERVYALALARVRSDPAGGRSRERAGG